MKSMKISTSYLEKNLPNLWFLKSFNALDLLNYKLVGVPLKSERRGALHPLRLPQIDPLERISESEAHQDSLPPRSGFS